MNTQIIYKSTNEFWVDSMPEVEQLHIDLQKQATEGGHTLTAFNWTMKPIKESGEVVGEYYVVKVVFQIDDPKNPAGFYHNVEFLQ